MIVHAYVVRSVALSDPQWEKLPTKREIVFPVGEPASNDGRRWRFTPQDLSAVVAAFGQRAEPAPVYWEHGQDVSKGKKAAGWIDKIEMGSDGLYAYVRYTDEAMAEIEAGSWGYRSPGFEGEEDEEGFTRPKALLEMSLVNEPAIAGMPPIQAAAEQSATAPALPDKTDEEGESMADSTTPGKVEAAKKKMAVALDGPGILTTLREAYAIPAAIDDTMFAALVAQALAGQAVDPDDLMEPESEAEAEKAQQPPADEATVASADVKTQLELQQRVTAAVQKAAALGRVTESTVEAAGKLAVADVESFETIFCAPVPPPAGRLINATASDRGPKQGETFADRVRAERFAAMRRQ